MTTSFKTVQDEGQNEWEKKAMVKMINAQTGVLFIFICATVGSKAVTSYKSQERMNFRDTLVGNVHISLSCKELGLQLIRVRKEGGS